MTAIRPTLKDLDTLRDTRDLGGLFMGIASGLFVSMAVLLFFAHLDVGGTDRALLVIPVGTAFLCTTISTMLAVRMDTPGKAVGWTFVGNVLPPTLLCLPTILGVIYATPAGLLAFGLTVPWVLGARVARRDTVGADARERLLGAAALTVATVVMLLANAVMLSLEIPTYEEPVRQLPELAHVPPLLTALGAVVLAAVTALPEVFRARFAERIRRGALPGLEIRETEGVAEVDQVETLAGGPMRGGQGRAPLGAMLVSPTRAAAGVALTAGGGALLALTGAFLAHAVL